MRRGCSRQRRGPRGTEHWIPDVSHGKASTACDGAVAQRAAPIKAHAGSSSALAQYVFNASAMSSNACCTVGHAWCLSCVQNCTIPTLRLASDPIVVRVEVMTVGRHHREVAIRNIWTIQIRWWRHADRRVFRRAPHRIARRHWRGWRRRRRAGRSWRCCGRRWLGRRRWCRLDERQQHVHTPTHRMQGASSIDPAATGCVHSSPPPTSATTLSTSIWFQWCILPPIIYRPSPLPALLARSTSLLPTSWPRV